MLRFLTGKHFQSFQLFCLILIHRDIFCLKKSFLCWKDSSQCRVLATNERGYSQLRFILLFLHS